ncbi:MAG: hypothetical protein ACMUIG_00310 [Thermoplasmatota archaeon]
MEYKKRSLIICFTILLFVGSIGGCLNIKDHGNGNDDELEDPLILTIFANQTSFTASEDLTIPIWVKLENIDDRSYEINSVELIRSTVEFNVTNSSGDRVTHFYGLVDSPPNIIMIDPESSIEKEFTIGGPMWQVHGITQETHFFFTETGEYNIQAFYRNWAMDDNDDRRFDLISNKVPVTVT